MHHSDSPALSLLTTALLVLCGNAEPSARQSAAAPPATELFVVAPSGNLYSVDPDVGVFQLLAQTSETLNSVQQIGRTLWLASPSGELLPFDLRTRSLGSGVSVPLEIGALGAHDGDLLVGGHDGRVLRVDVATGEQTLAARSAWPVDALGVSGNTVYTNTPQAAYQSIDLDGAAGFEATGFSAQAASALSITGAELYIGQRAGLVHVLDKLNGNFVYAYPVDNDATSIQRDGDTFLIAGSGGSILRVAEVVGTQLGVLWAPEPIAALWLAQPLGNFTASRGTLVSAAEETVEFRLEVPVEHAHLRYRVLASLSGTAPGIDGLGVHLPLNPDPLFEWSVGGGLSALMPGSEGRFGAAGAAQARLTIPAGGLPPFTVLSMAFFAVDAAGAVVGVSEPLDLTAL